MYYKIIIRESSKPLFSKDNYQMFNQREENYKTIEEVKEYLKDYYKKCKKEKMYIDTKDQEAKHIGYIYSFINQDMSHMSEKWLQQDWVEIREIEEKNIIIN